MAYRSDDRLFEKAAELCLRVVLPAANQLQIDLDTEEQYLHYLNQRALMHQKGFLSTEEVHPSKSGLPHRHVTLTLQQDISPELRIAFQAALGSDPKRELLSCIRVINEDPHPTGFMELPTLPEAA